MADQLATPVTVPPDADLGFGNGGGVLGGGGNGGRGEPRPDPFTAQLGLMGLLGTVTMLFAGFTSAYLVRRAGVSWETFSMPVLLWFNTVVLMASSATLEGARAALGRLSPGAVRSWLLATNVLGLGFVVGQLLAWRQLAQQGIFVPSSPHSSFFYILTGVHGLHLCGGILALLYVLYWARRASWRTALPTKFSVCAIYWHFVTGLWLYLLLLLFVV